MRTAPCPACGEKIAVPQCRACGAELECYACGTGLARDPADQLINRVAQTRDQTASARDQTSSDRDQTTSDDDQTLSERDQTSSDSDQQSSNEDQAAADDDLASGSDRTTYDRTTRARDHTTDDRDTASRMRDQSAEDRLGTASDRDRASASRDHSAGDRDTTSRPGADDDDAGGSWTEMLLRAEHDRERAHLDRERAADDRAQAAADRKEAARERAEALRVQTESAKLLDLAASDELTGARTRYFGLEEASRELDRARRTDTTLVLAFIGVDSLRDLNLTRGHAAGDALLRRVGEALRTNLRPNDVIVRYGGDEFVCAMPHITAPEARTRFQTIAAALAANNTNQSISLALVESQASESLQELIARADIELHTSRTTDEDSSAR